MLLRRATPDDIPFIQQLAHTIWWAHYIDIITEEQITYMLSLWYDTTNLQNQMNEGQDFWMVHDSDAEQPVGYIAVSQKEDGSYYLHKFYIDSRGKGIGAQAFEAIRQQYPDMKLMRLNVNRRNFKSVNFYFKVGFRIESCMELQVGDQFEMDDFVMVWGK